MSDEKMMTDLVAKLALQVDSADDLEAAVMQLKKRAMERMLNEELNQHLGYVKHAPEGYNGGNSRNGTSAKTVLNHAFFSFPG